MDSSGKPRPSSRFTVHNESSMVTISQSLLDKLVEGKGKQHQQQQHQQSQVKTADSLPGFDDAPKLISSGGDHQEPVAKSATFAPPTGDNSVALDTFQKAYESKLKLQESLWRQKTKQLEQLNDQLLKQNSLKLADEVGQFERRHFGHCGAASAAYVQSPCYSAESAVIECYSRNGKRSLLCSEAVNSFSECVRLASFGQLLGGR